MKPLQIAFFLIISAFLLGCSISIPDPNQINPLVEKNLSGEGDDKILIIEITGVISQKNKIKNISGKYDINSVAEIKEKLMLAEEDPAIKAVILLVDSPGGEVTATDIIYHEIKSFKERRNIPVIADISSVGASGAYYIAMASDRIVARPTSIVGSIGVIISSVNLTPLMEKIGVESVTYKSGAHKDMGSPMKPPSKDDDELFNSIIRQLHSQFVTIVTQNRKLDPARIDQITDGRVFSAQQALENHLIDQIGYFKDTVALAKRVANIKSESVIIYHRDGEFIENVYHVSDTSVMFQMMGLNLERLFTNDTPKFLYLWRP